MPSSYIYQTIRLHACSIVTLYACSIVTLVHTSIKQLSSMHVLLLLQNLVESFDESTIKESQRIFNRDQIIHYIHRSQRILVSIQSFDVPPDETQRILDVL